MSKKLDAMVAKNVFGYELHERLGMWYLPGTNATLADGKCVWQWSPSTDIAAAWEVVEKLRADDWLVAVKCNTDAAQFVIEGSRSEYDAPSLDRSVGPKGSCVCELTCMRLYRDNPSAFRNSEFAIQPTTPLAVCVAALLSVGVPEETIQEALK